MTGATAIADFIGAMEAVGIIPVEPIADRLGGDLIRFRCEGDGPGKRNGWARLHLDGVPAGCFGNYKLAINQKWRSGLVRRLTPAERRERATAIRVAAALRQAEKERIWEQVAMRAAQLWDCAGEALPDHPYLKRKGIGTEGLRCTDRSVLVPMRDGAGRIWNCQSIFPDGFKRFMKGGRIEGLFWLCGEPDGVLCIGEGMATVAAVRRATGHAVAASFSGANLERVARELHVLFPECDKILCADDDLALVDHPHIKRNLGRDYAAAAAAAVGGRVALPPKGETK